MEESVSLEAIDKALLNDEFEIVSRSPTTLPQLKIAGDGSFEGLWHSLGEMLAEELDISPLAISGGDAAQSSIAIDESSTISKDPASKAIVSDSKSVPSAEGDAGSKISPCTGDQSSAQNKGNINGTAETETNSDKGNAQSCDNSSNQSCDKFSDEIEEIDDILQDCTIFNGVSYLGSANVNAPKSDSEIQRNMVIFNEQAVEPIKVSISIPSCSDGSVVLYDELTNGVISRYEICRILFYAHGKPCSNETACFAFTWSHGQTIESSIFQCHIFRCDIPEAVGQVSSCFMKAFQRIPKSLTSSINYDMPADTELVNSSTQFIFDLTVEIKEDDGKGGFATVPRDRNVFKVRSNVEKQICLQIAQVASESQKLLDIKRCFGVLIAHGRHVKHSDMQLLDMVSMGGEAGGYSVVGAWDPRKDAAFESLNSVSSDSTRVFLTIALDLVVKGISEPVRLLVETQIRVFPQSERFWYLGRKNLVQPFYINLKELPSLEMNEAFYEVTSIETSGEVDRLNKLNLTLNSLASYIKSPSISSIDTLTPREEYCSDGDEPLISGTGEVSKDCSVSELESWKDVLIKWKDVRPRALAPLVRQGIPEALRGEVWQRLANTDSDLSVMDNYRILITKESNCETVIMRDINRTFPAHEFFREGSGGKGQEALFRISKAYAVYDVEVGYCQGLSFLAATLLLHMPEEQAFCVLIKLMYDYELRDLYKDGFECLYMRLYQLNRLLDEHLPQLSQHFRNKGVESHMFASQWFLTLYTARFPLYFVFHIIDVFLLQGTETLFQVALALLTMCKKDLLGLDFESTLKYFRVTLPKKCRSDEVARNLMKLACSFKLRKLKKYQQDFLAIKEAQESADQYSSELEKLKSELARSEEEKKRLDDELSQIKEMLKREVEKAENDNMKNISIIAGYKKVNQRLDGELNSTKSLLTDMRALVAGCERCSEMEKKLVSQLAGAKETGDPEGVHLVQRITELELQLAQAKLAQVEAECLNQDLSHQLSAAVAELQATGAASGRTAWPPWLSRTISSIKEAAVTKANMSAIRRDSAPVDSSVA